MVLYCISFTEIYLKKLIARTLSYDNKALSKNILGSYRHQLALDSLITYLQSAEIQFPLAH